MDFSPNHLYHVYNQGNNRELIFRNRYDYIIFLTLYKRFVHPYVDTIAWTLMPNHYHFMLHADARCLDVKLQGTVLIDPISNGFRKLQSNYARIYNKRHNRTGSAFRQKAKAKSLSDIHVEDGEDVRDYFVNCFHYIHQNPLTAGLVTKMEDWEFSSFANYANMRNGGLCRKDLAGLYCKYNPESFIKNSYEMVDKKMRGLFDQFD
jgi:putative transposase